VGGGAKVGVAAAADLPCDPRPPVSTAPPAPEPHVRASYCALLPPPPFAGGPQQSGADPVLPYPRVKSEEEERVGASTPRCDS
jgi:hypothetical protein